MVRSSTIIPQAQTCMACILQTPNGWSEPDAVSTNGVGISECIPAIPVEEGPASQALRDLALKEIHELKEKLESVASVSPSFAGAGNLERKLSRLELGRVVMAEEPAL